MAQTLFVKNRPNGIYIYSEKGTTNMDNKNDGCCTPEQYAEIVLYIKSEMDKLATVKGGEYTGGNADRLANFRRNADRLGLNMETVWAVYAGKHWDSLQTYVNDLEHGVDRPRSESITGRAMDLIVYLTLFMAMNKERETE